MKNKLELAEYLNMWAGQVCELNDKEFKDAVFEMLLKVRSMCDTSHSLKVLGDNLLDTFMSSTKKHECDYGNDGLCKICREHRPPSTR